MTKLFNTSNFVTLTKGHILYEFELVYSLKNEYAICKSRDGKYVLIHISKLNPLKYKKN